MASKVVLKVGVSLSILLMGTVTFAQWVEQIKCKFDEKKWHLGWSNKQKDSLFQS